MLVKIISLFTLVPLIELLILLKLSDITGWVLTISIIVITGILGGYLAKNQGRLIIGKIKMELKNGRMPEGELLNGLCVLIGGAFLLTPGVITDFLGFTLVLPGTRNVYKSMIKQKFKRMLENGDVHLFYRG